MSTVIDSLIVTLGLDPKGFSAGTKRAKNDMRDMSEDAKKRSAEIQKSGEAAAAFFAKLRKEALALAAAFTVGSGLKGFIESTITGAANLGFMAKNLDMSTESLGAWQKAAQRAGGTADGITAQLKESAQELANVKMGRGSEAATEFYRQGGIDVRNFKDGNEFLLARSKILHDIYAVDPTRAMVVAQRMGISEDSFNLLKQGPEAVQALVDAQRKNSQITEEQAQKALQLNNAWLDFKDRIQSVAMQLLLRMEPALTALMGKMQQLTEWLVAHQDDITRGIEKLINYDWQPLIDGAKQFAGAISEIAAGINKILDRWDDWTGKSKVQTPGVTKMAGNLRFGKQEDLDKDNAATGRPPTVNGDVKNPTLKKISDGIDMAFARTLASFGVQSAKEYVRDVTGKDDYYAGPKKVTPATPAPAPAPNTVPKVSAPTSPQSPEAQKRLAALEGQYGLPSGILDKMWKLESNRGDPKAMLSPKGAKGHFGFMDATAKEYGLKNPNDFNESSEAAAKAMRDMLQRNGGDLNKALAAYNWGQGKLNAQGLSKAPLETRNYIRTVNPTGTNLQRPNVSNSDVVINGDINVNTQATDAAGIANNIRTELQQRLAPSQSNTGLY